MNRLSCGGVGRRLSAFHDDELPVEEQVAVEAHLRACVDCAARVAGLEELGEVMRAGAALAGHRSDDLEGLQGDIVNRIRVEREASMPAQVSRAFEDMRLGFAALGSTAATVVSILLMIVIFYFGPRSERPDSLAGMMETIGAQSVAVESGLMMPRVSDGGTEVPGDLTSEEDAVFALSAVVTRNGRIVNLEVVLAQQLSAAEQRRVVRLLDRVSRARFEPGRVGGTAVSVQTVFLLTHTTVRPKLPLTPKQSALPSSFRPLFG
ncbi:MAG: zf-HC2 domain-containing protein [Acidobacteriota bacterium]